MDTAAEVAEHAARGCTMKYAVWFVRFLFAAWMIPAGLNHFVTLFPQPLGTQPLSQELFLALFDSHLFDLVKAVELVAGIGVLLGIYVPLSLVICIPVSFCVWYWDTPLEGWHSGASIFGTAVLVTNVLLLLAYFSSYRSMFAWPSTPRPLGGKQLVLAVRLIFGAWMLLNGVNHFFVSLYALPAAHAPLAVQLMNGVVNSHLIDVVMGIELVTGALILVGVFVPAALCVVMPLTVCAAFWALLDHQPVNLLLGLGALALNGLLMLAYLDYYNGVLQRHALAVGEDEKSNFDLLYVQAAGRTGRGEFIGALITLLAAYAFYHFLVPGRNSQWVQLTLLFPAVVLLARRLHDMGINAWLLIVPAGLVLATAYLYLYAAGVEAKGMVAVAATVVSAAFMVWGLVAKSQAEANRLRPAAA
jgi:uncharacterized membrane protein YhaH (DUF805 family)/uncharacterized membrane protein YphA (DoxX/SURF4 family)